mgnify:CR=1 FL=1
MSEEEIKAIEDFRASLLDAIEQASPNLKPHEAVFAGVDIFTELAVDMAPSLRVAYDTVRAATDMHFEDECICS